uniref:ARF interacting protein 2 n=1 Tax=Chrysemys picta bellii TaxID=8478 RepID=A0A8C3HPV8_CHRPI
MTDGLMSKAATMEIPINGTGDTGSLPEDDGLEQDLQQVMVSGPNLNETSIVSGGYGGTAEGIIPTSSGLHPPHPSPLAAGDEATRGIAVEKFDIVKKWGINTYKCTKQLISERFGRGSRTVDLELETQIELLRDTKRKYECVLQLARALTHHFYSLVQTQHALGDAFSDLSQKSPELQVWARGAAFPFAQSRPPVASAGHSSSTGLLRWAGRWPGLTCAGHAGAPLPPGQECRALSPLPGEKWFVFLANLIPGSTPPPTSVKVPE